MLAGTGKPGRRPGNCNYALESGVKRTYRDERALCPRPVAQFRRRCVRCLALLFWLLPPAPAPAASLDVAVVISNSSAPYMELARGIAAGLDSSGAGKTRVLSLEEIARLGSENANVIVAVGVKAVDALAARDPRVPVLNTLIPRATFESIAKQRRGRENNSDAFSVVYLDQPLGRQLDLIRLATPGRKRIGVVLGPDSAGMLESLTAEARARGLQVYAARIKNEAELPAALQTVLAESDVLLSLPDSVAFNSRTLQSVLFTAYHYQVPVIGFSPAYVRAGALAAVHSTPAQLAQQIIEILKRVNLQRPTLPEPQYSDYFDVAVNEHVARSLEIRLDKEDVLAAKLRASRTKP